MAMKKYKPTTPTLRYRTVTDFTGLTKKTPEKSLLQPIKKSGGRNNAGRMTMRRMGGGHKRRYRNVDFKRDKFDIPAKIVSVEYDPNRSAFISLLHYRDGEKRYILAPHGIKIGDTVISGPGVDIHPGNALPLEKIPTGLFVHNIELIRGRGGQGRELRTPPPAQRRDSNGSQGGLRDHRSGEQCRSRECFPREGRQGTLAGKETEGQGCRHESDRSSLRWG